MTGQTRLSQRKTRALVRCRAMGFHVYRTGSGPPVVLVHGSIQNSFGLQWVRGFNEVFVGFLRGAGP